MARAAQRKVGIPSKRRGQQMGYAGHPDQNREENEETPAVLGERPKYNKMAGDVSYSKAGTSSVTPHTNAPSTPAMNTGPLGNSGGEKGFKRRLAKKRARSS
jgi:hypothetical protein